MASGAKISSSLATNEICSGIPDSGLLGRRALHWSLRLGHKVRSKGQFTQFYPVNFFLIQKHHKKGLVKYHRLLRNVLRAGVTCNVQSEVLTKGEVIFMTSLNLKLLHLPPLGKGSKKYMGE